MSGVSPAETNVAVDQIHQSAIRDGDAVGIAAKVTQNVFRTTEGRLGIDDPVLAEQCSEPGCEDAWFGEPSELAMELEITVL